MPAIRVPVGSRAVKDRLRSFNFCMGRSIGSHQRRWNAISSPPPHSIFHHGIRRRGGTISMAALPSADGRAKRTYDLTSSILPRGTSFHSSVELRFSPISFDPARTSYRCAFPGPPELGDVDPYVGRDKRTPT